MDWTELYPFLFGIGLIAAVMLAYGLGLHVGKRQERVAISRKRWKQKQFLIGRHQTEREQYLEKIRFLEKELGRISQESADYQQKLDDIAFYRQKILICEQQIKQLSSAETEHPGLSLLLQLKEDPQHTNLSRQEWETLFAFTDLLFNNTLSSLQEKYNLTRHEQVAVFPQGTTRRLQQYLRSTCQIEESPQKATPARRQDRFGLVCLATGLKPALTYPLKRAKKIAGAHLMHQITRCKVA